MNRSTELDYVSRPLVDEPRPLDDGSEPDAPGRRQAPSMQSDEQAKPENAKPENAATPASAPPLHPELRAIAVDARRRVVLAATLTAALLAPAVNALVLGNDRPWTSVFARRGVVDVGAVIEGLTAALVAFLLARFQTRPGTHPIASAFAGAVAGVLYTALVLPMAWLEPSTIGTDRLTLIVLAPLLTSFISGPVGATFAFVFELGAWPLRRAMERPTIELDWRSWRFAAQLFAAGAFALWWVTSQRALDALGVVTWASQPPLVLVVPVGAALATLVWAYRARRAHGHLVAALTSDAHPRLTIAPLDPALPLDGLVLYSEGPPTHAIYERGASYRSAPRPLGLLSLGPLSSGDRPSPQRSGSQRPAS